MFISGGCAGLEASGFAFNSARQVALFHFTLRFVMQWSCSYDMPSSLRGNVSSVESARA